MFIKTRFNIANINIISNIHALYYNIDVCLGNTPTPQPTNSIFTKNISIYDGKFF